MEALFWLGFGGVAYAYFGYPLVLMLWGALRPRPVRMGVSDVPHISVVVPVHNEEALLAAKLDNLLSLAFPPERMEVLVVSDGSTDATALIARDFEGRDPRIRLVELAERRGKGHATNAGVAQARGEIVVFTDAAILLEPGSVLALVRPFSDPEVACVSGEDVIAEVGGEGLYGRYELALRTLESRIHSPVGASGSFYAQRKEACPTFPEGLAPDFLSVLHVVERGERAVSEPSARGSMKAVRGHGDEFRRKVRTLVRGMTALSHYSHLMNPVRYGAFAFFLISHKLLRWAVPGFLFAMLAGNAGLLHRPFYAALAIPHFMFYAAGVLSVVGPESLSRLLPVRIAGYFLTVNGAIALAWWKFLRGQRTEIWTPSRR